jgi:hypothetical protein
MTRERATEVVLRPRVSIGSTSRRTTRQSGGEGLRGCPVTVVVWWWVGPRDPTVQNVIRPFRPRPVPLLMSAGRVDEPTGWYSGKCGTAGRRVHRIRLDRKRRIGERARGWGSPLRTASATLRGERPHREQAEKDHQGDPGTVTVKRDDSLALPDQGSASPDERDGKVVPCSPERHRRASSRAGHRVEGRQEEIRPWTDGRPGRRLILGAPGRSDGTEER